MTASVHAYMCNATCNCNINCMHSTVIMYNHNSVPMHAAFIITVNVPRLVIITSLLAIYFSETENTILPSMKS